MKTLVWVWVLAGALAGGGCATLEQSNADTGTPGRSVAKARASGSYDDFQISRIRRGQTTEAQLLEWFGAPEYREVATDGRTSLGWSWSGSSSGPGGALNAKLSPEDKVEAYSARQRSATDNRTVEFVERSKADVREHMEQWRREGWNVLSLSGPLPQPDGTTKRKAELSRTDPTNRSRAPYDDRLIAAIQRDKTTASELLERFGPACSRDLQPDGRMKLAWKFGDDTGALSADIAPDGRVDSYTARRGPR